jgi:hypothetical protein
MLSLDIIINKILIYKFNFHILDVKIELMSQFVDLKKTHPQFLLSESLSGKLVYPEKEPKTKDMILISSFPKCKERKLV